MFTIGARFWRLLPKAHAWHIGALFAIAVGIFSCISGSARTKQDSPWIDKDWKVWTRSDCLLVLQGSPWVKYTEYRLPSTSSVQLYWTRMELRSALPIRQALLRQLQLDKRYDKMNPPEKQAFDQQHKSDLTGNGDDGVVIRVVNNYFESIGTRDVDPYVLPAREVTLELSDGTLVMPIQTTALKKDDLYNEYEYVFPRSVNGNPLYTTADKNLKLLYGKALPYDKNHKKLGPQSRDTYKWDGSHNDLPIANMIYKGKLEF